MDKYTTKELLRLERNHDVKACSIPQCPKCAEYYEYLYGFRLQDSVMEQVEKGHLLPAIADSLCVSEEQVQAIVAANTNGKTISGLHHEHHQAAINELLEAGYSIPAIAKKLGRGTTAIRSYLNSNCLYPPQSRRIIFEDIKFDGGHRYFDNHGNEYQLKRIKPK